MILIFNYRNIDSLSSLCFIPSDKEKKKTQSCKKHYKIINMTMALYDLLKSYIMFGEKLRIYDQ